MIYIIAGNHLQADRKRKELGINNRECIVITMPSTVQRLRGRKWHSNEDQLYRTGTWYENPQQDISNELLIMGVPEDQAFA